MAASENKIYDLYWTPQCTEIRLRNQWVALQGNMAFPYYMRREWYAWERGYFENNRIKCKIYQIFGGHKKNDVENIYGSGIGRRRALTMQCLVYVIVNMKLLRSDFHEIVDGFASTKMKYRIGRLDGFGRLRPCFELNNSLEFLCKQQSTKYFLSLSNGVLRVITGVLTGNTEPR